MKFRIASDIHTEFFDKELATHHNLVDQSYLVLPAMESDPETTLILAGDIGSMHHQDCLEAFLREVCPRFKNVLYIPGNHEYYGGDLQTTVEKIEEIVAPYNNLFFTKSGSEFVDGKIIHMHTLWTDFDGNNHLSMNESARRMNDYRLISNGDRVAYPQDTYEEHLRHRFILRQSIKEGDIVVTHHSPSFKSLPEEYKHERVNGAYHSDLEELILATKPALWVHGHTHTACDYKIGDTRVLCNPRGYGNQYKKNGYNSELVVEL